MKNIIILYFCTRACVPRQCSLSSYPCKSLNRYVKRANNLLILMASQNQATGKKRLWHVSNNIMNSDYCYNRNHRKAYNRKLLLIFNYYVPYIVLNITYE